MSSFAGPPASQGMYRWLLSIISIAAVLTGAYCQTTKPFKPEGYLADQLGSLMAPGSSFKEFEAAVNGFYLLCLERSWFPVGSIGACIPSFLSSKCERKSAS